MMADLELMDPVQVDAELRARDLEIERLPADVKALEDIIRGRIKPVPADVLKE